MAWVLLATGCVCLFSFLLTSDSRAELAKLFNKLLGAMKSKQNPGSIWCRVSGDVTGVRGGCTAVRCCDRLAFRPRRARRVVRG
jgi:hypothetical protein